MYDKQTWANNPEGGTPITAMRLNHMEDGIYDTSLTADEALTTADAANAGAFAAQSTANAAQSTADAANTAASAAQSAAEAAQSTADGASTAASNAQDTADTAQSVAEAAQTAANNAQSAADDAQDDATDALTAATTAQDTANAAQTLAGTHAARHATAGADPVSPASIGAAATAHVHAEGDVTGLTAALAGKIDASDIGEPNGIAPLDGASYVPLAYIPDLSAQYVSTSGGTVVGNLTIQRDDTTGEYALRTDGSALNFDAAGADLYVSVWSGAAVGAGTERVYVRAEAGTQLLHLIGRTVISTSPFGDEITLDPENPPSVTGSRTDGTALASLLTALETIGLIVDDTEP